MYAAVSSTVMCIFQLAATIGLRMRINLADSVDRLPVGKRGHAGQFLAFEQFERRAAARGNKRHPVRQTRLLDRRHAVAAADDRRGVRLGQRLGQAERAASRNRESRRSRPVRSKGPSSPLAISCLYSSIVSAPISTAS